MQKTGVWWIIPEAVKTWDYTDKWYQYRKKQTPKEQFKDWSAWFPKEPNLTRYPPIALEGRYWVICEVCGTVLMRTYSHPEIYDAPCRLCKSKYTYTIDTKHDCQLKIPKGK